MRMLRNMLIAGAVFAVGLVAAGSSAPGFAQGGGLEMLDGLAKGEWTVRQRDGSPSRKICVRTGRELIQLQHKQTNCNRFVVDDNAAEVTVQYTCPGNGYGRTSIRRETPVLVQVETQGIAGGLPFEFSAEARRTGDCR